MISDTTAFHDFFTSSIKKRLPPLPDNLLSFIYSCVCPVSTGLVLVRMSITTNSETLMK